MNNMFNRQPDTSLGTASNPPKFCYVIADVFVRLVVYLHTPLKNMKVRLGKMKNVPNHQPVVILVEVFILFHPSEVPWPEFLAEAGEPHQRLEPESTASTTVRSHRLHRSAPKILRDFQMVKINHSRNLLTTLENQFLNQVVVPGQQKADCLFCFGKARPGAVSIQCQARLFLRAPRYCHNFSLKLCYFSLKLWPS